MKNKILSLFVGLIGVLAIGEMGQAAIIYDGTDMQFVTTANSFYIDYGDNSTTTIDLFFGSGSVLSGTGVTSRIIANNQGTDGIGIIMYDAQDNRWEVSDNAGTFRPIGYGDGTSSMNRVIHGLGIYQDSQPYSADLDNTLFNETGTYMINGQRYEKTTSDLITIPVNSGPGAFRWDAVTINASGTLGVIVGTTSANPVYPEIPSGQIALAYVFTRNSGAAAQIFNASPLDVASTNSAVTAPGPNSITLVAGGNNTQVLRVNDIVSITHNGGSVATARVASITSATVFSIDTISATLPAGLKNVTVTRHAEFVVDARGDLNSADFTYNRGTVLFNGNGGTWIDRAGYAWDSVSRGTATYPVASATCAAIGGELPSVDNLRARANTGGAFSMPNYATNSVLWAADAYSGTQGHTVNINTGAIAGPVTFTTATNFRCVKKT